VILLFYIAGAVAVISTLAVILQTNIVHALIYLILSLLAVAVCFYVLGAPFAAVLEVIMMLNMGQRSIDEERSWMGPRAWIVPSILAAVLLAQLLTVISTYDHQLALTTVDVMDVSALLFGPYVLAVELASILLLAGLVSAYHLAKK
jgi:NADH-quinone oxidoreductase subunit J